MGKSRKVGDYYQATLWDSFPGAEALSTEGILAQLETWMKQHKRELSKLDRLLELVRRAK